MRGAHFLLQTRTKGCAPDDHECQDVTRCRISVRRQSSLRLIRHCSQGRGSELLVVVAPEFFKFRSHLIPESAVDFTNF